MIVAKELRETSARLFTGELRVVERMNFLQSLKRDDDRRAQYVQCLTEAIADGLLDEDPLKLVRPEEIDHPEFIGLIDFHSQAHAAFSQRVRDRAEAEAAEAEAAKVEAAKVAAAAAAAASVAASAEPELPTLTIEPTPEHLEPSDRIIPMTPVEERASEWEGESAAVEPIINPSVESPIEVTAELDPLPLAEFEPVDTADSIPEPSPESIEELPAAAAVAEATEVVESAATPDGDEWAFARPAGAPASEAPTGTQAEPALEGAAPLSGTSVLEKDSDGLILPGTASGAAAVPVPWKRSARWPIVLWAVAALLLCALIYGWWSERQPEEPARIAKPKFRYRLSIDPGAQLAKAANPLPEPDPLLVEVDPDPVHFAEPEVATDTFIALTDLPAGDNAGLLADALAPGEMVISSPFDFSDTSSADTSSADVQPTESADVGFELSTPATADESDFWQLETAPTFTMDGERLDASATDERPLPATASVSIDPVRPSSVNVAEEEEGLFIRMRPTMHMIAAPAGPPNLPKNLPATTKDLWLFAYTVGADETKESLSRNFSVTHKELDQWNPDLDWSELKKGERVLVECMQVEVVWGDTVSTLASRFHVKAGLLREVNRIGKDNVIRKGQRLFIPGYRSETKRFSLYTIQAGDRLDELARVFDVPAKELKQVSGIGDDEGLKVGAVIQVPILSHRIRKGDSLSVIAEQYNTRSEAIRRLNPNKLKDDSLVKEGDRLFIPRVRKLERLNPLKDVI